VFWREALTNEILVQKVVVPIFNPTHHLICFRLAFLAVRNDFVRKRCGGNSACLFLAKNSKRYNNVL
jgi:hypothetical protein